MLRLADEEVAVLYSRHITEEKFVVGGESATNFFYGDAKYLILDVGGMFFLFNKLLAVANTMRLTAFSS